MGLSSLFQNVLAGSYAILRFITEKQRGALLTFYMASVACVGTLLFNCILAVFCTCVEVVSKVLFLAA